MSSSDIPEDVAKILSFGSKIYFSSLKSAHFIYIIDLCPAEDKDILRWQATDIITNIIYKNSKSTSESRSPINFL